MLKPTSPANFRKSLAAIGLILGPLLLLIATIVEPDTADEGADYLNDVAANADRVEATTVLFMFGFLALIAGVIGIVHVIRERGVVLAHIAGVIAVVGLVFFIALVSTSIYDLSLAENTARAEGVKAHDGVEEYASAYFVFIPALLGTLIGLILLSVAIWRARIVPAWVPALVFLGFAGIVVGDGSKPVNIVANALLLVGFGYIATKLLAMSDDEWDRPRGAIGAPPASEARTPEAVAS